MKYKIYDNQLGQYFHDGELFDDLESVRRQLIEYHDIDWTGENDINDLTLAEILDYGDWDIHDEDGNEVNILNNEVLI